MINLDIYCTEFKFSTGHGERNIIIYNISRYCLFFIEIYKYIL